LLALKIYSLRHIRYKFLALTVNFGTQPQKAEFLVIY